MIKKFSTLVYKKSQYVMIYEDINTIYFLNKIQQNVDNDLTSYRGHRKFLWGIISWGVPP